MVFPLAQQLSSLGSHWSVKNTFLHCDVQRSEDATGRGSKWKARTDISAARDQSAVDYLRSFLYGRTATRNLCEFIVLEDGNADYQRSVASTDDECDVECNVGNMQQHRVSFSLGASGHKTGTCKPCGWNWRKGGCTKGAECDFCHLCEEGVVKQRRKEKLARLRAAEKVARRAQKVSLLCDDNVNSFKAADMES